MDTTTYAATAEDIDALSKFQIANFLHRHNCITKGNCNYMAANIINASVSPTLVQGQASYTVAADACHPPKVVQLAAQAFAASL